MAEFGIWFYGFALIAALVLVVCWTVLPFAVIGTKRLLRQVVDEQRRTNALLQQLADHAPTSGSVVANARREPTK